MISNSENIPTKQHNSPYFIDKDSESWTSTFPPHQLGNGYVLSFKPKFVSLGSCCYPKMI